MRALASYSLSTIVLLLVSTCRSPSEQAPSPESAPADPRTAAAPAAAPDEIEGERLVSVLAPDVIPAIDAPTFVTAEEADLFMDPDEPVLGVVGSNGTAKCYSAWQLDRHEVVNDVLDGRPITATW